MTLPPSVSRLIARLAFLASLLFAAGAGPSSLITTLLASTSEEAGGLGDRDEEDNFADEDADLHRHASLAEREAEESARREEHVSAAPRALRAVPFTPAHRVTRAPPRPPYRPLLRMLC